MNLFGKKEKTPAQTVIEDVCKIKKSEKVLIIANPETSVIAQNLFTSALDSGAKPTLIYQTKKTSADFAEETVVGAIKSEPDVIFSISEIKLGKDDGYVKLNALINNKPLDIEVTLHIKNGRIRTIKYEDKIYVNTDANDLIKSLMPNKALVIKKDDLINLLKN